MGCIVRDISPSQDGWHSFNQASWSLDVSQVGTTISPSQSLNESRRQTEVVAASILKLCVQ